MKFLVIYFFTLCLLMAGCTTVRVIVPPQTDVFVGKAGPEASSTDIGVATKAFALRSIFQGICQDRILFDNSLGCLYVSCEDGSTNFISYVNGCELTTNLTAHSSSLWCPKPTPLSITLSVGPFTPQEQVLIDAGMPMTLMHTIRLGSNFVPLLRIKLRASLTMTNGPYVSSTLITIPRTNQNDFFQVTMGQ